MKPLTNYEDPERGSVMMPLSPLVAAIEAASFEDIALLTIALARAEREKANET
jgi:hypothetical protein